MHSLTIDQIKEMAKLSQDIITKRKLNDTKNTIKTNEHLRNNRLKQLLTESSASTDQS